jgi:hypothetical protein
LEILYGGKIDGVKVMMTSCDELSGRTGSTLFAKTLAAKVFDNYCRKHPQLIAAILRTQLALRKDYLGEPFWRSLTKRREKDPELDSAEFIYSLMQEVYKKYKEKNAKLKLEERLKKFGKDREGLAQLFNAIRQQAGNTRTDSEISEEVVFDHSKIKYFEPIQTMEKKRQFITAA